MKGRPIRAADRGGLDQPPGGFAATLPSSGEHAALAASKQDRARRIEMAIEGKSERAQGPIRYGMVGGGQGAFIGGVHRIAARMDGEFQLVAGALSSDPARAKASAAELGLDPERSYGTLPGDGQGRGQAQGRHRGGRHRHAEPHAFRPGQGVPRSGHPRHLRQAADLVAGRCQEARGDRRKVRQAVRADPQLHRLSDGPAGARHGRRRACSATSASCRPNTRRTG